MKRHTCVACGREKKTPSHRYPRCRTCASLARGPALCGWCRKPGHDSRTCELDIGHVEAQRRRRPKRNMKRRIERARKRQQMVDSDSISS